jgi:hypothetical protein
VYRRTRAQETGGSELLLDAREERLPRQDLGSWEVEWLGDVRNHDAGDLGVRLGKRTEAAQVGA